MTERIDIPDIQPYELPRICNDLPVCGGKYKTEPEDFRVDELAYTEWSGTGEYLCLQIETRQMTSQTLGQHIHNLMEVPFPSIRIAGRKDKRAITSQWVTIHRGDPEKIARLEEWPLREGQHIRVLQVARHHKAMMFGVHGGNRFGIVLRGFAPDRFDAAWQAAQRIAGRLKVTGIANFYGEQRLQEDYADWGREILLDMYEGVPATQARFLMSSYQAQLFNRYLAYRVSQGLWNTVLEGDWMRELNVNGPPEMALCTAEQLAWWQDRQDAFEYIATGPMFGRNLLLAAGLPGRWEAAILKQEELYLDEFFNEEFQFPWGNRRYLRLPVKQLTLTPDFSRHHIHLDFVLPPGGYATTVLHEFGATHANTFF